MIASLDDAWQWYISTRELARAMQALGSKHWNALPWNGPLGQDNRLRNLEGTTVVRQSDVLLGDLDDLCVLLLFSVFEASVRERALQDVNAELPPLRHPALRAAVRTLNESLEHGSFFRVTEAYKELDSELVEQVNQVRKFRNWVAHGRRGSPENNVDPQTAYTRLRLFLQRLNESGSI